MIIFFVLIAVVVGCASLLFFAGLGLLKALLFAALMSSGLVLAIGIYRFFRKAPRTERGQDAGIADYDRLSLNGGFTHDGRGM